MTLNDIAEQQRFATCPECKRVFDLMDEDDAGEFFYGHDCEAPSRPPTIDEPGFVPLDRPPNTYNDGTGLQCWDCGLRLILFDNDEHFCEVTGTSTTFHENCERECCNGDDD